MGRILIFVDTRESNSGIIEYFKQYDCTVEKKMLICGDYIVSDRICIERKLTDDFVQSIVDKRLFQQIKAMKENFEKPIMIIEGNTLYGKLHPNVIRGALASVVIDFGIPIIWTKDAADTAGIIFWVAKREQIDERREIPLKGKKIPQTTEEQQEYLVSALPDVSAVRARSLLKHFKSPENVFNASEKELKKVDKIGPKIARNIKKILKSDYKLTKK